MLSVNKAFLNGRYWTRTPLENKANTEGVDESGAESGALPGDSDPNRTPATPTDPQLAAVVAAWPNLPEPIRRAVLALIGAGGGV